MKINSTIIGILLILFLGASVFYLGKQLVKQNQHIQDLQQNQQLLLGDSLNMKLDLNKQEFQRLLEPLLDSIEAIKGIKPKHITNVTKIYNNYYDSTTVINEAPQLTDSTYDIGIGDPCWGFDGSFNILSKQATITNRWANDEITKFTYFKRNRLFGWKRAPRWGNKRYYIDSYSKCNSKVKVEEFEMNKK